MGKPARDEVCAARDGRRIVLVAIAGEAVAVGCVVEVILVGDAGKHMYAFGGVIVRARGIVVVAERSTIVSAICTERRGHLVEVVRILLDALGGAEEEQLVLENRRSKAAAHLVALEGKIRPAGCVGGTGTLVAEESEALAMELICARVGADGNGAGTGQFARNVERGAADLELFDRALAHVQRGRADGLVGDVLAIEHDAGGTAVHAVEGDGGVARLGGIECLAALQLHTRLQLGEVKEVATADGQVVDLLLGEHTRHRGLNGIDLEGFGAHNDLFARSAQLQPQIAVGGGADLHRQCGRGPGKTCFSNDDQVLAGHHGCNAVKAGRIGRDDLLGACGHVGDRDLSAREDTSLGVADGALDCACGGSRLAISMVLKQRGRYHQRKDDSKA